MICNGKKLLCIGHEGSKKRCGGQGDVLCGCTALFAYYASEFCKENKDSSFQENMLYSCAGGCILTRQAGKLAYEKKKRALTTPSIIKQIGPAFQLLFGE